MGGTFYISSGQRTLICKVSFNVCYPKIQSWMCGYVLLRWDKAPSRQLFISIKIPPNMRWKRHCFIATPMTNVQIIWAVKLWLMWSETYNRYTHTHTYTHPNILFYSGAHVAAGQIYHKDTTIYSCQNKF